MATCILFDNTAGPVNRSATTGITVATWRMGDATYSDGVYTCPSGTHLVLTVAEVNKPPEFTLDLPALGITPETILLVASMGGALVLGSFFAGWGVGIAKGLIKKI